MKMRHSVVLKNIGCRNSKLKIQKKAKLKAKVKPAVKPALLLSKK